MYKIKKVLNSSVVLVQDDNKERVLLGKGIGFGKKVGEVVLEKDISQIFVPIENSTMEQFIQNISEYNPIFFDITNKLIKKAKELLNVEVTEAIYFALLDHLQFVMERYYQNMLISNKVFWEIKTYYANEYFIGEYGVQLLNEQFNVTIPIEEAANIAFHFINAQGTNRRTQGMVYAKLIGELMHLVEKQHYVQFDLKNVNHSRFMTHLKFFVERYIDNLMLDSDDTILFDNISKQYPEAMKVAYDINEYIKVKYNKVMTNEELIFLAIHFNRLFKTKKDYDR